MVPTIILRYSKYGTPLSDYDVGDRLKAMKDEEILLVCNATIVNMARLMHAKGLLKLRLFFQSLELEVNEYGVVLDCPNEFLSLDAQISEEILILAKKKWTEKSFI